MNNTNKTESSKTDDNKIKKTLDQHVLDNDCTYNNINTRNSQNETQSLSETKNTINIADLNVNKPNMQDFKDIKESAGNNKYNEDGFNNKNNFMENIGDEYYAYNINNDITNNTKNIEDNIDIIKQTDSVDTSFLYDIHSKTNDNTNNELRINTFNEEGYTNYQDNGFFSDITSNNNNYNGYPNHNFNIDNISNYNMPPKTNNSTFISPYIFNGYNQMFSNQAHDSRNAPPTMNNNITDPQINISTNTYNKRVKNRMKKPVPPLKAFTQLDPNLFDFLSNAPNQITLSNPIKKYTLLNGDVIHCIYNNNHYYITGTDIVKLIIWKFSVSGFSIFSIKKLEEGIFSDLRNLKPGIDATLEKPRSKFLELLYKHGCIRTQKKQKVFFWYSVPHDTLFNDAIEREVRRESSFEMFLNYNNYTTGNNTAILQQPNNFNDNSNFMLNNNYPLSNFTLNDTKYNHTDNFNHINNNNINNDAFNMKDINHYTFANKNPYIKKFENMSEREKQREFEKLKPLEELINDGINSQNTTITCGNNNKNIDIKYNLRTNSPEILEDNKSNRMEFNNRKNEGFDINLNNKNEKQGVNQKMNEIESDMNNDTEVNNKKMIKK